MKTHKPFDCIECGGRVEAGHLATETFTRGEQVAIVYDVPVSKCGQCGHTYTTGPVMKHLQAMVLPHLDEGDRLFAAYYDGPGRTAAGKPLQGTTDPLVSEG